MARDKTKLALFAGLALSGAALMAARGAGRRAPPRGGRLAAHAGGRPHVVVVGAGFGGLEAARPLAGIPGLDLTLIDAHNYHLFQPLLYQVATAALSPADIASPVRAVLPARDGFRVLMAAVSGVDTVRRQVMCGDRSLPYDCLVIATGSKPSHFGHPEWAAAAPGLKTLDDAVALRNAIVSALERAALTADATEQERLLTFVLIGGGPTGVEMAGAIGEFVRDRLLASYAIAPERASIILVEAGKRVLAEFAPNLSADAAAALKSLGVTIRTGVKVTNIEAGRVHLGSETIMAETVIWAAGMAATPVASWLGVQPGHGGRVAVGPDLRVTGHGDVFVIGDASLARDPHGHPLPGLAPVAKQQGAYVAEAILRRLGGQPDPAPFRYRDYGTMATIGRNKAVAQFGSVRLSGFPAWLLWAGAHIAFLISFRSRALVSLEWAFAYVTHGRSAGLIIADEAPPRSASRADPQAG